MINRYDWYKKFQNFLIFIKVDENCNLRCSFCYQHKKKQNRIDNEEKLNNCMKNLCLGIDKFIKIRNSDEYEKSKLNICFFGGEPTLNTWAIENIALRLKETYNKDILNKISFSMTTNGILFNDDVKNALTLVKSINDIPLCIMISSDNSKEVYDKNRKLVNSNKSGFEIVQENIKKYREFLNQINGYEDDTFVSISTVLATPEQLRTSPDLIQEKYKDINRSGKILYDLGHQSKEYIEESKIFLFNAYSNIISDCNKHNKDESISVAMESVWQLGKDDKFTECKSLYAIDGNGDVNWCNKIKNFENEVLTQDEMRDIAIFNPNTDNSHFKCVKDKLLGGKVCKDIIRPILWEYMISKFDPNVPIQKLNVYIKPDKNVYNFIKYMICGTNCNDKEIYIENPSIEIIDLCRNENITILDKEINYEYQNVFCLDKNYNLFFDKILSCDDNFILTNAKEKHFMWIHTPTMLNSINAFYKEKIKKI